MTFSDEVAALPEGAVKWRSDDEIVGTCSAIAFEAANGMYGVAGHDGEIGAGYLLQGGDRLGAAVTSPRRWAPLSEVIQAIKAHERERCARLVREAAAERRQLALDSHSIEPEREAGRLSHIAAWLEVGPLMRPDFRARSWRLGHCPEGDAA